MKLRRLLAVAAIPVVTVFGVALVAHADGTTQAVECSSDGTTLSCPLPPPVTVTQTADQTVTATVVTTKTKRVTTTVTAAPTSSSAPVSTTPTTDSSTPVTSDTPTTSSAPSTTSADPTTTTSSGTPASFPDASDTGVPAGTTLTTYTGSCTITTANLVIDSQIVNCATSGVAIEAANVTIKNSQVHGSVTIDTDVNQSWSLTMTDSEVTGNNGDYPAITNGNFVGARLNIHGGHNGLECQEHSHHCVLTDSWIHGQWQDPTAPTHLGGVLDLGEAVSCDGPNGDCIELIHNNIVCDPPANKNGGGCTGDINLLPHWGPLNGALIQGNYLGANVGASFCTYGGDGMEYPASRVRYLDNVFARGTNGICAAYGPGTNFDPNATGNVWTNNKWDDGTILPPTV